MHACTRIRHIHVVLQYLHKHTQQRTHTHTRHTCVGTPLTLPRVLLLCLLDNPTILSSCLTESCSETSSSSTQSNGSFVFRTTRSLLTTRHLLLRTKVAVYMYVLYVCICTYICMYVCMYVCMHVSVTEAAHF